MTALPLIGIVCGSPADGDHAAKIAGHARTFGCEVEVRIASAHRTPEHAMAVLRAFETAAAERPVVLVTVAGRSNALSGFADPQVSIPVIACPPPSETHATADIWSSLRMPGGVAPVVVLGPVHGVLARLQFGQVLLASIGATAPFVGLFGTVWGIYHALVSISAAGNITIEKISGPVGEALIMTAAGLAVAIPAVLAYNLFGKWVAACEAELEGFAHDLRELLTAKD